MKTVSLLIILIALSTASWGEDEIVAPARVSLDEATRQILKEGNKRVLGASTEIIDGREIHIIKVLTPDGHIQHYKIDAESGAIISQ
jgi:uncharacterized membrane protein YkoI